MTPLAPPDALLLSLMMQVTLGGVFVVAISGLERHFNDPAIVALARGWATFLLVMLEAIGYVRVSEAQVAPALRAAVAIVEDVTVIAMWWLWRPTAERLAGHAKPRSLAGDRATQVAVVLLAASVDILAAMGKTWFSPDFLDHVASAAFALLAYRAWRLGRDGHHNPGALRWLAFGYLLFSVRIELTVGIMMHQSLQVAVFAQTAAVAVLQVAQVASFGVICLTLVLGLERASVVAQAERLRDMESRLARARHLASLGELAARVAHDFNNILTAIIGGLGLVRLQRRSVAEAATELDLVEKAADRGRELVAQLLGYAKPSAAAGDRCSIGDFVERCATSVIRVAGDAVHVRVDVSCPEAEVGLSLTTLERIVLNLITNARDASPHGGEVHLVIGAMASAGPPPALVGRLASDDHVTISVIDFGAGIPDELRERIFEPFFSTKGERGTGLGLATVAAIVSQAGGEVAVTSTPGAGTRIDLRLPRLRGPQRHTAAA